MPAPVWPAVTTASALPSRTSSVATTIELRFLRTSAFAGCSSMPISSGAWTTLTFAGASPSNGRMTASSPHRMTWSTGLDRA